MTGFSSDCFSVLHKSAVMVVLAGGVLCWPRLAGSQVTPPTARPILSAEATPIGALPPIALPMPASRDDSYWGVRLQVGQRRERGLEDLLAVAAGIDYQFRGGSIFGLTGGYQWQQNCQSTTGDCRHALYGARARFNLITGGPTIAGLLGDNGATSTLGTELGFGYAPAVMTGQNACTINVGNTAFRSRCWNACTL